MRYLFISMIISAGILLYLSSKQGRASLAAIPGLKSEKTLSQSKDKNAEAADDSDEPEETPLVQIHGKWYKYRADNTYVIDGVPTLHIAKKPKTKTALVDQGSQPSGNGKNLDLEKSQKLAEMAGENPFKVYTPDGFQTLKEGLEAAQNSAKERKKSLEELTREP